MTTAQWLQNRSEVERVMYPALPSDPGYTLWQRDFTGANGLFGIEFAADIDQNAADRFLNALTVFLRGFSWGGYESLAMSTSGTSIKRAVSHWAPQGPTVRLHVGLEDPADLVTDPEQAFDAMKSGESA